MAPRKLKRFWLCRHNHPMWRKPGSGHWICHTCNELNLNHSGVEMDYCLYGHKRVKGTNCKTCKIYINTPWMRQLDLTGESECRNGHPVSHYDDSILYVKSKKAKHRRCRKCTRHAVDKARSLAPDLTVRPKCRSGEHDRTPENTLHMPGRGRQCKPCWERARAEMLNRRALQKEAKSTLRPSYVDWVVVERLLQKGQMDYFRRGRHVGPTDGERWVAYCTFRARHGGRHPEDMYGEVGHDAMKLWKLSAWRKLGTKHQWREFTVDDVKAIIHTDEYLSGGFLLRYKNGRNKRENPRS